MSLDRTKAELLVDDWLMNDFFQDTRVEVTTWLKERNFSDIDSRLGGKSKLTFGTAGLRARMGAGYDRMNCLTVLQTTQGLAAYLESIGVASKGSVVIGFDGRHNSESYAHVTAAVMLSRGISVSLIDRPSPTPFNPFWINQSGSICGVQITASHNPKMDNGYKLYWSNGAQIVPPIDSAVAESIEKNRAVSQSVFAFLDPTTCRLRPNTGDKLNLVADQVFKAYMSVIASDVSRNPKSSNEASPIKFAYTAMHGVGFEPFKALFKAFGFDSDKSLSAVASQVEIDPEFPTVKFPNPEEKGALNLAIAEANASNCDLVLANDPDADRFTCVERQADGSWYQFTGDELGLLFGDWQMSNSSTTGGLLVCSVVSSRMLSELCKVRSAKGPAKYVFSDCLTGFKWISNESIRLRSPHVKHLLGYEEAIGYQVSSIVPDKDGLSAACAMAEFATYLRTERNLTLKERFEEIQQSEIGFFSTSNGYFIIDDPNVTRSIFSEFRASGMKQLGPFPIRSIRDVTNGIDTSLPEGTQSHLPSTPDAEMITMFFENGAVVTVRASGTEPKVKYYSEMSSKVSKGDAQSALAKVVDAVKIHFYQPGKYPMKEQPSM